MLTKIKKLIATIEDYPLSFGVWVASFISIITIRVGLEIFVYVGGRTPTFLSYLHSSAFFTTLAVSLIIVLYLFTKENIAKIAKIALVGWLLTWLPPAVDFIVFRGNAYASYVFAPLAELPMRFITFFGRPFDVGVTVGVRTQITLACLGVAVYVFLKTKKWWKAVLVVPICYTIMFLFGTMPVYLATATTGNLTLMTPDILAAVTLSPAPLELQKSGILEYFDFSMTAIFLLVLIAETALLYYFLNRKKFWAVVRNIRGLRFVLQGTAVVAGLYLGFRLLATGEPLSLMLLVSIALLALSILFSWMVSVGMNDIYDQGIDAITNRWRPLVSGVLTVREYWYILGVLFAFSLLATYILGEKFFTLMLVIHGISFLYSVPPIRLRRYPIVTSGIMAVGFLCAVFLGFMMFAPQQSLEKFPHNLILLIFLFLTIAINIKDVKDFEGDRKNGVWTILTLFGLKRGKLILAILSALSFLLFPTLFVISTPLLIASFAFALFSFLLIYNDRFHETYAFLLYTAYLVLVFVVSF